MRVVNKKLVCKSCGENLSGSLPIAYGTECKYCGELI